MKLLVVFAAICLSLYPNQCALGNAISTEDCIKIDDGVETTEEIGVATTEESDVATTEEIDVATTKEIDVATTEEIDVTTSENDIATIQEIDDEPFVCTNENLTLHMSNLEISKLGTGFIASPLISCLNFENMGLNSIERGAFNRIPNLRYLNLAKNNITPLNLFEFGGHPKLERLILKGQSVSGENDTTRVTGVYPALRYLDLSNTKIHGLAGPSSQNYDSSNDMIKYPDVTRSFPALTHLDLSSNGIDSIDKFMNTLIHEKLTHLHLRGNKISIFSNKHLNNLRVLSLDDNLIQSISYDLGRHGPYGQLRRYYKFKISHLQLHGLENLRRLTLKRNQIRVIESDAFSEMTRLQYLDLSENNIRHFVDIVGAIKSLRTLLINGNSLFAIPAIPVPTNLTILSVNCNQIEYLNVKTLRKYPHLKELHLAGNNITSLDSSTFRSQTALEKLNLAHNLLSYLPEGLLEPLKKLRLLDVSGNDFINLYSLSLRRSHGLQKLYMMGMTINEIKASAIEALPKNVTVYLHPDVEHVPVVCKTKYFDN